MSETRSESTRAEFEDILRKRGLLEAGEVMTDAVMVAAIEKFDDKTTGYAWIFPDGHQAWHVTQGLLWAALERRHDLNGEEGG